MTVDIYNQQNSEYAQKNPNWHIEDSPWKASQIISIINRNKIAPKTIVEIGCGAGEILTQLSKRLDNKEANLFGYDIAPDAVIFWKDREGDKIHFFNENLLEKDLYFDCLLMIDVFEHVEDYFSFIKAASSKAKYKIYHIPLDISLVSVIRNKLLYARKSVGHLHFFMKDTALSTLLDCGEEIIDYNYTAGAVETSNLKLRTKILNIPRKILYKLNKDWAVRLFGGYSLIVLTK